MFTAVSKATLLFAACILLSGCPAQWKFVFVNAADEPLQVQVTGAERILIPAGGRREQPFPPARSEAEFYAAAITTFTASGRPLHSANAYKTFQSLSRGEAQYPHLFVRISRKGIAAIPDPSKAPR